MGAALSLGVALFLGMGLFALIWWGFLALADRLREPKKRQKEAPEDVTGITREHSQKVA